MYGSKGWMEVRDKTLKVEQKENKKTEKGNEKQIGAPLQGMLSKLLVKKGDAVKKNQQLFVIEAMKMETTVYADQPARVAEVLVKPGTQVDGGDLLLRRDQSAVHPDLRTGIAVRGSCPHHEMRHRRDRGQRFSPEPERRDGSQVVVGPWPTPGLRWSRWRCPRCPAHCCPAADPSRSVPPGR